MILIMKIQKNHKKNIGFMKDIGELNNEMLYLR